MPRKVDIPATLLYNICKIVYNQRRPSSDYSELPAFNCGYGAVKCDMGVVLCT